MDCAGALASLKLGRMIEQRPQQQQRHTTATFAEIDQVAERMQQEAKAAAQIRTENAHAEMTTLHIGEPWYARIQRLDECNALFGLGLRWQAKLRLQRSRRLWSTSRR